MTRDLAFRNSRCPSAAIDFQVEDYLKDYPGYLAYHTEDEATLAIDLAIAVVRNEQMELIGLQEKLAPHLTPGMTLRDAAAAMLRARGAATAPR